MSDPTSPFSDDLREYYYSAPPDVVALDTFEFRHPAFLNEAGAIVAIRVVNDPNELIATLEANAPMNGGESVTFSASAFEVTLPESSSPGLPTCDIQVTNVSRLLTPWLKKATQSPAPVQITYRQYLADDRSAPGFVLDGLTIRKATANYLRVIATAGYEDFLNMPFPRTIYTTSEFTGLVR
ncbi:MAG: DUF1833 family protein [Rhizomicrobium sp.]